MGLSGDGSVLAVGAYLVGNVGEVRVYGWDAVANEWERRGQNINGEIAESWAGRSLALSKDGRVLAVGEQRYGYNNDDIDFTGRVRVFRWDPVVERWKTSGAPINGIPGGSLSMFGSTLALDADGSILAIGAHYYLSLIHIPSPRDQRGSRMPSSA